MQYKARAFTLLEMLTVIGIVMLLVAIVLPAFSRARMGAQTLACNAHLRELARGWQIYADLNDGVLLPGRMYKKPGGVENRENWYDVGNGLKYRPRWAATMGAQVGIFAFSHPSKTDDRQDYESEVYACPTEPTWIDERNHGYGYNHQFLGNARQTGDRFHNFPVMQSQIKKPSGTVIVADSMGTAAGFATHERGGYENDGPNEYANLGNHGWSLDPPRLTEESDRGSGDEDSTRTAVDPRHRGKANVVFGDAHTATMTPHELGYRITKSGRYADLHSEEAEPDTEPGGGPARVDPLPGRGAHQPQLDAQPTDIEDPANNRYFSGTGRDDDPPPLPEAPE
jgi:prepilin-type processing-associated H-X9-DG protein